jgi:dihydroorotate dehydrogenase (NAD+) catalytic subunit
METKLNSMKERYPESLEIGGGKRDLRIAPPLMNTAGCLGFADEAKKVFNIERLGALVTNPISLSPRSPAHGRRFVPFEGGFLLHTGHPNPGCTRVIQAHRMRWASLQIPIIPHLIASSADEIYRMIDRLESVDNVQAIELGLQRSDLDLALDLSAAAQTGELPVIANLPLDFDPRHLPLVEAAGVHAISMGPPRGTIVSAEGDKLSGRLYGPHLLPLALNALEAWCALSQLPLIAAGGVYQESAAMAMFELGASAVQLSTILWTEPESFLSQFFLRVSEDS